jgi:NAD-dependent dihydropyrimidine dehydrogenase PreA subunit
MQPFIAEELCERCGECMVMCPYEVFGEKDGRVVVETPEDCIECIVCVDSCPCNAISMSD